MRGTKLKLLAAAGALLSALALPAAAQDTPPAEPPPPSDSVGPTPSDTRAPTPAPSGNAQLPAVEVIQKQAAARTQGRAEEGGAQEAGNAPPAPQPLPTETLEPGTGGIDSGTVLMSPVDGSAIPIGKYPGAVGRGSAADIQRSGDTYVPQVLQQTVPGVILEDAQGNAFQQNLQFRGFDSSPVNGVPQGPRRLPERRAHQRVLRRHRQLGLPARQRHRRHDHHRRQPGVRPQRAGRRRHHLHARRLQLSGRRARRARRLLRPLPGRADARRQLAAPGAASWRSKASTTAATATSRPARIRRMYTDIGAKGDNTEFHLNFTGANNFVGVTAAAPVQLLDLGWSNTFTSPQTTNNELAMISANGSVKATPTLTFSGVGYYRWFRQRHLDGNLIEALDCAPPDAGLLCIEDDDAPAVDTNGNNFAVRPRHRLRLPRPHLADTPTALALAGQGVEKTPVAGLPNQFLLGASIDHGHVPYATSSELGQFGPQFVVNGFNPPFIFAEPDDFAARNLTTQNTYLGVYFSDTLDVTTRFRADRGRPLQLRARPDHRQHRQQPRGRRRQQVLPLQPDGGRHLPAGMGHDAVRLLRGGQPRADAGRARLRRSRQSVLDRELPHRRPAFAAGRLADLRAGLARQAGLMGRRTRTCSGPPASSTRSTPTTSSPWRRRCQGRGYFQNAGDTLRQGVEAGLRYTEKRLMFYANYAFVSATFETPLELSSPNNPAAVPCSGDPTANVRQRVTAAIAFPESPSTGSRPASTIGSRRSGSSAPISLPPATRSSSATRATTTRRSRATPRSICTAPTT